MIELGQFGQDPVATAAPLAAALGAVLLYYQLGTQWLGPDDDFWSPLRHALFPLLDYWGKRLLGRNVYAVGRSKPVEYAATVERSADEFETVLHRRGFVKNPWAAACRAPDGRKSSSSMALRQVSHPSLRAVLDLVRRLPLAPRVVDLLEALLATRQVHVRLYEVDADSADVYVHEEANSVSPLVALDHYTAGSYSSKRGVAWVRAHLSVWGVTHNIIPTKRPRSSRTRAEKAN